MRLCTSARSPISLAYICDHGAARRQTLRPSAYYRQQRSPSSPGSRLGGNITLSADHILIALVGRGRRGCGIMLGTRGLVPASGLVPVRGKG
jgi:hypothetical protein